MIGHLEGTVLRADAAAVLLSVQGVGFEITVTPGVSARARTGSPLALDTLLVVREDSLTLYGFDSAGERAAFELLLSVSGIGPKSAMATLATLGTDGLAAALESGDEAAFKSVPGIGPKTARLVLAQLAGKVVAGGAASAAPGAHANVVEALIGLGWSEKAATDAASAAASDSAIAQDAAALLRAALQQLGGQR